jgi:hypothetical protein
LDNVSRQANRATEKTDEEVLQVFTSGKVFGKRGKPILFALLFLGAVLAACSPAVEQSPVVPTSPPTATPLPQLLVSSGVSVLGEDVYRSDVRFDLANGQSRRDSWCEGNYCYHDMPICEYSMSGAEYEHYSAFAARQAVLFDAINDRLTRFLGLDTILEGSGGLLTVVYLPRENRSVVRTDCDSEHGLVPQGALAELKAVREITTPRGFSVTAKASEEYLFVEVESLDGSSVAYRAPMERVRDIITSTLEGTWDEGLLQLRYEFADLPGNAEAGEAAFVQNVLSQTLQAPSAGVLAVTLRLVPNDFEGRVEIVPLVQRGIELAASDFDGSVGCTVHGYLSDELRAVVDAGFDSDGRLRLQRWWFWASASGWYSADGELHGEMTVYDFVAGDAYVYAVEAND